MGMIIIISAAIPISVALYFQTMHKHIAEVQMIYFLLN